MPVKYELGTESEVVKNLVEYAVRDQEALIDALTPNYSRPDRDTSKAIKDCEKFIRDFRKFGKSFKGG